MPIHYFMLGAIAKAVATVVTYPYITIKTRLQAKGKYTGTIDVVRKISRQEGLLGFYKGMDSKIVQSVLTAALLFMIEERFSAYILRLLVFLAPKFVVLKKIQPQLLAEAK